MGKISQILLVAIFSLLNAGSTEKKVTRVDAEQYFSFWLWGGVKPPPFLAKAKQLYILQGEVVHDGKKNKIEAQGITIARLKETKVWLVYRASSLNWSPEILQNMISRIKAWEKSGNTIIGVQIDFDASTRQLHRYVAFLKELRAQLPLEYRLSITGLLDWTSNGDVHTINQLKGIVDEVVIQTYQGRKTIPEYQKYLYKIKDLKIPFQIGLVQHGEWRALKVLEANPKFGGYVVFLQ